MLVTFQEAPLHFSADYVDEADFAVVEAWNYVDVSTQEEALRLCSCSAGYRSGATTVCLPTTGRVASRRLGMAEGSIRYLSCSE